MQDYLNKKKSSGDYGRRETLPPSLQTKMNQSFGMDFSSVKLYRNDEMSGTGMQGLASGNRVIISKDVDLNSKLGQAVLGHELSHIRAQSQGIGMGNSGLLNNAALEHQADKEGMMAAMGQPIFGERAGMNMGAGMGGMSTLTPLSGGLAASAGAPMQARKATRAEKKAARYAEFGKYFRRHIPKNVDTGIGSHIYECRDEDEEFDMLEDSYENGEIVNTAPAERSREDSHHKSEEKPSSNTTGDGKNELIYNRPEFMTKNFIKGLAYKLAWTLSGGYGKK